MSFDVNNCTLQEACDYAVQKIVEQGKRCVSGGACMYADGKGNHCAVGWLLDHSDAELMDGGLPIEALLESSPESMPEIIKRNVEVFGTLQSFHDDGNATIRLIYCQRLRKLGIDTSGEHWQKWVEMGAQ